MNDNLGGGSLTALPIIETQANDMSAYIPTNVISITDGQIYLESGLFYSGFRPAINIGLSVSRVGGAAQIKAMKQTAGTLRIDLAQFRELESFSQFASELDEATRNQLLRGEKLMEVLKQKQFSPMPVEEQVVVLFSGVGGYLDDIETEKIGKFEEELLRTFRTQYGELLKRIVSEGKMSDQLKDELKTAINKFKETFTA
jgi:F-type H+-transporting ATPase subunit alpha